MNKKPSTRKINWRGLVSLSLTGIFFLAMLTGLALYFSPKGRVAHWTDWTLLGLSKAEWSAVHMNACCVLMILAIVHLILNWSIFWCYIKKKATAGINLKFELAIAVFITLAIAFGSFYLIPPFSYTVELNDSIKRYWAAQAELAPAPHAEGFTLQRFARQIGLSADDVQKALQNEGYTVDDKSITIGQLAAQKGVAPSDVYSAIKKHFPEASTIHGPGMGQGRGMGRGMGQGRGMGRGMGQGRGAGKGRDLE